VVISNVSTGNPWTLHRIRPDGKLEIPTVQHPDAVTGLTLDGLVDDGLAIQAALERVEDGARGGRVLVHGVPGEVAYINSTITMSQSGTILDFDIPVKMGPEGRFRPWGIIDEEPKANPDKPALTADAPQGATVLHVTAIPAGWAAGDYVGIRGKRTSSGSVPVSEIFYSYVASINVGALTITLADPLPKIFEAEWDTSWTNKLTQITKVTQAKLTGTPDAGDVTITMGSTADFNVGDMVQVIDDTQTVSDNPARKEVALVAEITSGTAMKLSHALYHSYSLGADARVQKFLPLEDCEIRNLRATWDAQGADGTHAIEVRYAHNVHVKDFAIEGGGDDGVSWSGHAVRFTDSLSCSATRGIISNPSDVTAGRGYGISYYGSTLCWVDNLTITGTRHSVLWFAAASGCEARNVVSTDCRISDYDWHGAGCNGNRTTSCTAVGGTRNTVDSSTRSAWKYGNPAHQGNDFGNTATDCLVLNYAGVAIEGLPTCGDSLWQGVVRGAEVGIKVEPLPLDGTALLNGLTVRGSDFYDVAQPFDIDGGASEIVRGLVIDDNRWYRCGPFEITGAPGARITGNRVIDPDMGTDYVLTATSCDNILVLDNDFSLAPKGMAFQSCPAFRATDNRLHDLTDSTVVFRDNGGNAGYLFRDNDYIGYTPTSSIGTASAGTLELLRATGGGGGGGTYPPAGGVPFADLDASLQGVVSGAYVFPGGGIPETDLAAAVQTSLGKADTAYQKPVGGIPNSDLETPGGGGSGGYSADMPSEHAYEEWNFDPTIPTSTSAATAGRLEMMRVRVRSSGTRTKAVISVGTAASGLTSAYAAVFDAAGNQLAVTADIASTISSTGVKSLTMVANYTLTAGQDVYVAILQVGGTPAAFHRAVTSAGLGNAGLNAAAGYRFMSSGSGLTAMPSTVTITSGTSSSNTYWCALG
jgi:hypothetical protein